MEGFIALEGYTIHGEVHTIFVLSKYVEGPEISGEWIMRESSDKEDIEEGECDKRCESEEEEIE
jgi:hypothetical protein